MIQAAPDLTDHEPDCEADRHAADDVDDETPRRVPEREAARENRRDGEAIRDEGGRVVDQALALDQRCEPAWDAEPCCDRIRRDGVGGRDERAEHEADRPREARDGGMADGRNGDRRREHEPDREQRERTDVSP